MNFISISSCLYSISHNQEQEAESSTRRDLYLLKHFNGLARMCVDGFFEES